MFCGELNNKFDKQDMEAVELGDDQFLPCC